MPQILAWTGFVPESRLGGDRTSVARKYRQRTFFERAPISRIREPSCKRNRTCLRNSMSVGHVSDTGGHELAAFGWPVALLPALIVAFSAITLSPAANAQLCSVPGSHATVQSAVDDVNCATVEVDAGVFPESVLVTRSVAVVGDAGGGTLLSALRAAGDGVALVAESLQLGCVTDALVSKDGASVNALNISIDYSVGLPCPIFGDRFETAGAAASTIVSSGERNT